MLIILFFFSYSWIRNRFCIDRSLGLQKKDRKSELFDYCQEDEQFLNGTGFSTLLKTYSNESIILNLINFNRKFPLEIDFSQSSIINFSIKGIKEKNFVHFRNIKRENSIEISNLNAIVEDTKITIKSFNISKSTFFSPNNKIDLFTNNLITDSISLKQKHFSSIYSSNFRTFTSSKPNISVQLLDDDMLLEKIEKANQFSNKHKVNLLSRKNLNTNSITNKTINYCLCSKIRFETCKKNLECDLYSIPIQNYVTGKEDSFKSEISNSFNRTIKMYVTGCEGIPINLGFEDFNGRNNTFYFFLVNSYRPAIISINDKFMSSSPSQDQVFSLVFNNIDEVIIDKGVIRHLNTVTLKQSPLVIKLASDLTIPRLYTDSYSIASFEGTLHISEFISLNGSVPQRLEGTIILEEGSTVYSPQISFFPYIFISDESLTFCDSYQDNDLEFNFAEVTDLTKKWTIFIENSKFSDNMTFPSVTFSLKTNPESTLPLNFLMGLQTGGISMKFDDLSKLAKYTLFNFQTNDEPEYNGTYALYLDIDYSDTLVNHPFKEIVGNFDVFLMSPKTIEYFYTNLNPDSCLTDQQSDQCDKITFYNLHNISFYVFDALTKILFENDKFSLYFDTFELECSEKFSQSFQIFGSTENGIVLSIDQTTRSIPKFVMTMENEDSSIYFDDSFSIFESSSYYKSVMDQINFLHGERNANFISATVKAIPMVGITENVAGILFDTSTNTQYDITAKTDFSVQSFRSGPTVIVNIAESNVLIPQNAFLSNDVIFRGSSFSFLFYQKARSSYTFENTVTILVENKTNLLTTIFERFPDINEDSIKIAFPWITTLKSNNYTGNLVEINEASFKGNGKLSQNENESLVIITEKLRCESLSAIDVSNLIAPIIIYDNFHIEDQSIERVVISNNSIRLFDSNHHSANVMKGSDRATFDIRLNTGNNPVQISSDNDDILSNVTFHVLNSNELYFDKSWFSTNHTERLLISAFTNVTIRTELLNMPRFTFKTNNQAHFLFVTNKPGFTSMKAFAIFILLIVLSVVFCFIFCFVDFCCSKAIDKEEKSSDSMDQYELDEIKVVSTADEKEAETDLKTSNADFKISVDTNQTTSKEIFEIHSSEDQKAENNEVVSEITETSYTDEYESQDS